MLAYAYYAIGDLALKPAVSDSNVVEERFQLFASSSLLNLAEWNCNGKSLLVIRHPELLLNPSSCGVVCSNMNGWNSISKKKTQ